MPSYKRYIMRDGNCIKLFTAKPKSFGHVRWYDYAGNLYKIIKLSRNELDNYDELFNDLPEWKLVEVSINVKVK